MFRSDEGSRYQKSARFENDAPPSGGRAFNTGFTVTNSVPPLSAEAKLQRRKEERNFKKERERTLAYFTAASKALEGAADDVMTRAVIVDGFCTELSKRLQIDCAEDTATGDLDLLRNAFVCRTIESALKLGGSLVHTKSILFLFLGKTAALMMSPTASYVVEMLFACTARGLLELLDANGNEVAATSSTAASRVDCEVHTDHGVHSGVPSTRRVLEAVVDEVCDSIDKLLVDAAGSRSLRTLLLLLSGSRAVMAKVAHSERSNARLVKFTSLLQTLVSKIVQCIEKQFAPLPSDLPAATARGEAWLAASCSVCPSAVIQCLLQHVCCADGCSFVRQLVRHSVFESLVVQNNKSSQEEMEPGSETMPLLAAIMFDSIGCHVLQAYIRCPKSDSETSTSITTHPLMLDEVSEENEKQQPGPGKQASANRANKAQRFLSAVQGGASASVVEEHPNGPRCCWQIALTDIVLPLLDTTLLHPAADREMLRTASFVLQDLAVFAPNEAFLQFLWKAVLRPRVALILRTNVLGTVLLRFTRKCAFNGSKIGTGADAFSTFEESDKQVKKDEDGGAVYFHVSSIFRTNVCQHITNALREMSTKRAAAHALIVDRVLGETVGFELAANLLHFGLQAAALFVHTFEKLCTQDLVLTAKHPQGTHVLQQLVKCLAATPPQAAVKKTSAACISDKAAPPQRLKGGAVSSSTTLPHRPAPAPPKASVSTAPAPNSTQQPPQLDPSPLGKFLRRLLPFLHELASSKYAAFVIEAIYEHGSLLVKEELVRKLCPLLEAAKKEEQEHRSSIIASKRAWEESDPTDAEAVALAEGETAASAGRFVLNKVLIKCCVEQFVVHPEQWRTATARQTSIRKLMQHIIATEGA